MSSKSKIHELMKRIFIHSKNNHCLTKVKKFLISIITIIIIICNLTLFFIISLYLKNDLSHFLNHHLTLKHTSKTRYYAYSYNALST